MVVLLRVAFDWLMRHCAIIKLPFEMGMGGEEEGGNDIWSD